MTTWIEYSLLFLNGQGLQPYETFGQLGAQFDGGQFVENGRYRGRLTCETDALTSTLASATIFGAAIVSNADIIAIVERMQPINSTLQPHPGDETPLYLGPVSLGDDLQIVREISPTPFA